MELNGLERLDWHYLEAARGWLGLGNHGEAGAEIKNISAGSQGHPDVVEVRWRICRANQQWNECARLAAELLETAPGDFRSWVLAAQTHYFTQDYPRAYETLAPALELFPELWPVFYDMACYACLLGRMDEARALMNKAFALDKTGEARRTAQSDPDLTSLRDTVDGL